ncbi:S8 family serine peptidase [Carboxylicivirga marina]|uniref:S8 family serine peptidase n=1 Tax=Carboxylicivirga marina TaxID=2800988 RepID=A0ABS1HFR3_9BACT|nr:S8 family serine peptidase [Carboxylicivirga marina]MBK3516479.1 S8 family serine peptidase [Carboxylicivirga marina]
MIQFIKRYVKLILMATVMLLLGDSVLAQNLKGYKTGQVRIKFGQHMDNSLKGMSIQTLKSGTVATGLNEIDNLAHEYKVVKMKRIFPNAGKFEAKHRRHGLHLWYELEYAEDIDIENVLNAYNETSEVQNAEPVYEVEFYNGLNRRELKSTDATALNFPNDPKLKDQYFVYNNNEPAINGGADTYALNAWSLETGDSDVIVAVIDGGVDTSQVDLKANLWINKGEIPGNNIDDDNNGYVDDINGYNFVTGSGKLTPDMQRHGTHVAGTIGAVTNNETGIAGIAGGSGQGDGARIMSCAIFSDRSSTGATEKANVFIYAADNGAVIAQNSWGYTYPGVAEQVVLDAIDYFIDNAGYDENDRPVGPMQGGIVFFAAGNNGDYDDYYPGCYHRVRAVGASDSEDKITRFSNYGHWVDIIAPGSRILSTLGETTYSFMDGTSMACPQVSGAAALIVSKYKNKITPNEVWTRLRNSADSIEHLNEDYKGLIGTGRLNTFHALMELENDNLIPNQVTDLSASNIGPVSMDLQWTAPGRGAGNEGSVSYYELRYSEDPITADNFHQAQEFKMRHALPAGEREEINLNGLYPGKKYFIALVAKDYYGNRSEISNVISVVAQEAPVMVLPKGEIHSINRQNGNIHTFALNVLNEGQRDLIIDPSYELTTYTGLGTGNISFNTTQLTLASGASLDIQVVYNINEDVPDGKYTANFVLNTNDPFQSEAKVPVEIFIYGDSASLIAPQSVDLGKVYAGHETTKSFNIYNDSNVEGLLVVESLELSSTDLSVNNRLPIYIMPGDSAQIDLSCLSNDVKELSSTVGLYTNQGVDVTNIAISASIVNPPVIDVVNNDMSAVVPQDESEEFVFTVSNSGADELHLDFSVSPIIYDINNNLVNPLSLQTELFSDSFLSTEFSTGWETQNDDDSQGWILSDDASSDGFIIPEHDGIYASVNDDNSGQTSYGRRDYLITPEVSLDNLTDVTLEFDSYYTGANSMLATVEISLNNGETWMPIYQPEGNEEWVTETISLRQFVGQKVKLAFHADDRGVQSSGWAIDNIKMTGTLEWAVVELVSGSTPVMPGESSEFKLSISPFFLEHGIYQTTLNITSNDPAKSKLSVPIMLEVLGTGNALLSELKLDGVLIDNFNPEQFIYYVDINGSVFPAIDVLAQNPNAVVELREPTNLARGFEALTAEIKVVSADGSNSRTYTIFFKGHVGISEMDVRRLINIYPNPFNEMLYVDSQRGEHVVLTIYDVTGRLMLQEQINGNGLHSINTSALDNGIYLLKLNIDGESYNYSKMVKVK